MTREEEIKHAAHAQYCNSESMCFTLLCNAFKQGAEWADNNPNKLRKPQNKVHFYVVRDKDGDLTMWLGTPYRYNGYWDSIDNSVLIASGDNELTLYGLDVEDYDNLKLEDGPIEVFLNMEE